ncbi:hypothetical protein [Acinetobacter indicus]|uniref:hypothetical protein n=1 Tax=Acinetobacter indicus TaxID=756892 RepID=UPI0039893302
MIHIDEIWLSTQPMDMRAGMDTTMAQVLRAFGSIKPHCAYIYPAPYPAISDAPFVASAADTATIPIIINPVPPVAKPTINAAVNVLAIIPVPNFTVSTTVVLALSE